MTLLSGFWFEILLYIICIEIAILLGVRLCIEIAGLIKSRPIDPLKILASIPTLDTSGLGTGQYMPDQDENAVTVEERVWAQEQGATTDKEINTLVLEARKS